jgi:hypothetical protein
MRLLAGFTPVSLNDGRGPIVPDDTLRRLKRGQSSGQFDNRSRDRAQHHRHQGGAAGRHRSWSDLRL